MTRDWSRYRLLGPHPGRDGDHIPPTLTDTLARLVRYLRITDSGGRWFFHPLENGAGPGLGLGFHSTVVVRDELERLLLAESARIGWPVVPDVERPCEADATVAERFTMARTEFVLDLRHEGGDGARPGLELAVLHLWHLLDVVAVGDRRPFLFTCWRTWTRQLRPQRRMDLSALAGRAAAEIALRGTRVPLTDSGRLAWHRYVTAIRATAVRRLEGDTVPLNYLLFDHAHLTHRLLRMSADTEATAAAALHAVLALDPPVRRQSFHLDRRGFADAVPLTGTLSA